MSRPTTLISRLNRLYRNRSIQFMIAISFTLVAVVSMVVMGVLLYSQFVGNLRQTVILENRQLVNQIALNINNYNARMRDISNSMYYNVIKKADLAQPQPLSREMSLIYEANTGSLVSIACFTEDGELVAAAPNANPKPDVEVVRQEWFIRANDVIENPHFSTPHVQNLFVDSSQRHHWVISLSRMVELTRGGGTERGVLLVDMSYSGIEMIFRQMGSDAAGYAYLIDKSGEIIYHPKQKLIFSGLFEENNLAAAEYVDGIHQESFDGAGRQVIVKTVSYTGWRIVSVIPNSEFAVTFSQLRILVIAIVGMTIFLVTIMNTFVSARVADPIKRLDQSVGELESGNLDLDIYIGGPYEVEHLGKTISTTVSQMRGLMDDIVVEQEEKRKSEFDALQAQINPHFLYNTLDSIIWMIESDRYKEAISMVRALASLFRIALSKGNLIIPIRAELQHAQHYMYIQNIRYKNKFTVEYDVDPSIEDCTTIKLIIQPLLENAIYHAMEMMDGDGEILIRGRRLNEDIYIEIRDNGLGMTPEKVAGLFSGEISSGTKGSGIGLKNVHQRIQLYYGSAYGLEIESELDVGTTVRIHLPARQDEAAQDKGVNAK